LGWCGGHDAIAALVAREWRRPSRGAAIRLGTAEALGTVLLEPIDQQVDAL
jgi:hypothetical protein